MTADYSRDALIRFFEYLASKGLANANTISARKAAANRMLSVLDENEAADLRTIDLEQVANRFFNLYGKDFTPDSMNVYKSRLRSGVDDFIRYTENPSAFKSDAPRQRSSNRIEGDAKTARKTNTSGQGSPSDKHSSSGSSGGDNVFPIPIRPELVVKLIGLPPDLSRKEANKIANIVLAFAIDDGD